MASDEWGDAASQYPRDTVQPSGSNPVGRNGGARNLEARGGSRLSPERRRASRRFNWRSLFGGQRGGSGDRSALGHPESGDGATGHSLSGKIAPFPGQTGPAERWMEVRPTADSSKPRPRAAQMRGRGSAYPARPGRPAPGNFTGPGITPPNLERPNFSRRPEGDPGRAARAMQRQQSHLPRRPSQPLTPVQKGAVYALCLLVAGVGTAVLGGTLLSSLDPTKRPAKQPSLAASSEATPKGGPVPGQGLKLGQEIAPLKTALQNLTSKTPNFFPGVYILDLGDGNYVNLNADLTFSAASTIKIPILVAFLEEVDRGNIRFDELMTLKKEHIAEGSGDMQFLAPGTQMSAMEVATNMMIHSDNSATNLIIEKLGGISALNQRFAGWGLQVTKLNNLLPDLGGTNVTTPKELGTLLGRISQGELLAMGSRDRMLDIMQQTVNDSMLPQSSDGTPGLKVAHKTGDIDVMLADVGVLTLPNGKRYIASMMMKRPKNDDQATLLIHQMGRMTYQVFNRPAGVPANAPMPAATPGARPAGSPPEGSPAPATPPIPQ